MPRRLALAALAVATAVTSAVAVVGSGEGATASVTTNQVYPVPASGTYTLKGHGWGHGHGMSQHGAQGAALKGLSAQQILAFYYPGTQRTIAADGLIRVLISGDTSDPVVVVNRSGLSVRDLGDQSTYALPTNLAAQRWRLLASTATQDRVQWYDGTAWKDWKAGVKTALAGRGEFFSADGPVTLVKDSGTTAYRGTLRSAAPVVGSKARNTVNVVSLDDYVKGVIPAEMPASWATMAVRAQAVAARTYAVYDRDAHYDRYYQICDTTACQVYKGASAEDPRSNSAADKTAGQIRTTDGKTAAFTQFSASNGGWTSAGSFSYLPHKADPYDRWSGNTNKDWTAKLTAARIQKAYPAAGRLLRIRVIKREGGGDWQGRVQWLVLEGTKSNLTIQGDEFRSKFGLKSTWFRF
jgi:SpoIID/LytB domain protein